MYKIHPEFMWVYCFTGKETESVQWERLRVKNSLGKKRQRCQGLHLSLK